MLGKQCPAVILLPVGQKWRSVGREIDPIFGDPPSWLQTIGWFAFAYGPFYAAVAYGFLRRSSWLPYILLPLAGMVVATTGVYFVEELTGDVQPLNWPIFYLINGPYIVVPSWLRSG